MYCITLDDASVFELSEDVFISANLEVGFAIDDDRRNELLYQEAIPQAYQTSLSLLKYRMRSEAEIKIRLQQKGYSTDTIAVVINDLINKKYLNDKVFASAFINDKIHSRLLGPIALRRELQSHQLNNKLMKKLLKNAYTEYPEAGLVERLIAKRKIEKDQSLSQKDRQRLLNFLLRKGHRWDVICNVLEALNIH